VTSEHGPGVAWLAARTGKDPAEIASSPAKALGNALRELATLAARAESAEPAVREAAAAELGALCEEIAAAPPPSEAFLTTVAGALRHAAERLKSEDG
jgi:predicted HD phosphohydrolase